MSYHSVAPIISNELEDGVMMMWKFRKEFGAEARKIVMSERLRLLGFR